jgi:hypothetical protein
MRWGLLLVPLAAAWFLLVFTSHGVLIGSGTQDGRRTCTYFTGLGTVTEEFDTTGPAQCARLVEFY